VAVVEDAVWFANGEIHDGSQSYPVPDRLTTDLAPTLHGVAYGVRGATVVYQPTAGSSTVIGRHSHLGPVADPTSDLVAWFERKGEQTAVVVVDAEEGTEVVRRDLGDLEVTAPALAISRGQSPIQWVGANADGGVTVFFVADKRPWRFDNERATGEQLTRLQMDDVPSYSVDASLEVLAHAAPHERRTMVFAAATGAGAPHSREELLSSVSPLQTDGTLSHDGSTYAGFGRDPMPSFVDTASGERRTATASGLVAPFHLAWSRSDVLMFVSPDVSDTNTPTFLVYACTASDASCRLVQSGVRFRDAALPTP
jgi:hypothetical protein